LCPNCHSQTATYCGRNKKLGPPPTCLDCGTLISLGAKRCCPCSAKHRARSRKSSPRCRHCGAPTSRGYTQCLSCSAKRRKPPSKPRLTKITWPPSEELKARVESESYLAVARDLGVSDNAIRKHLRKHPPENTLP
jgi:hypothetical protein